MVDCIAMPLYNTSVVKALNRRLDGRKAKTIAFVSESILPTQVGRMLDCAAAYAQGNRSCSIRLVLEKLLSRQGIFAGCDGILADVDRQDTIDLLKATGLPIVATTILDAPDIPYVDFSPEATGKMAAEWFLQRRFTSFAFCGTYGNLFYDRLGEVFSTTLRNAGFDCITCDRKKINETALRTRAVSVPSYLDKWIPTLPPRTAVFCIHDRRASLVIESCLRLGRAVPDDIAVMGRHNDTAICLCSPTAITSIDPNLRLQTYTALQLLEEMIDNPDSAKEKKSILIPPLGVVERESTNVYPVDPPWLAKALMLIDDNLDRRIALGDLAAAADISQSALQSAIRKAFGMSVNKYILSAKMREAKRLIDNGGYSVKELAARTGFSTQSYFTRAYTAYYGHPPIADRRRP